MNGAWKENAGIWLKCRRVERNGMENRPIFIYFTIRLLFFFLGLYLVVVDAVVVVVAATGKQRLFVVCFVVLVGGFSIHISFLSNRIIFFSEPRQF